MARGHGGIDQGTIFPRTALSSEVSIKQLIIMHLFFTHNLFILNLLAFETKNPHLMNISVEMVHMAKYAPSEKQSECSDLLLDYRAI